MGFDSILDVPIYAYERGRGAFFTIEYSILNLLQAGLPGTEKYRAKFDLKTLLAIRRELVSLLQRDAANIRRGVYPVSVLAPESPLKHVTRIPKIMLDGLSLYWRRRAGKTAVFNEAAREFLDELPRYYRRNFHFQTDGYLSERSAELYEHQVEMLFGGAADAMRRMILPPMREHFAKNKDGKGLTFLEIGAGTGRATRFVRQAFPKAKIVVTDLSDPYLKKARENLSRYSRIDFVQADGAELPFEDKHFDAVYSIFLYHELPRDARKGVIAESKRVLKPGGFFGFVDSLQTNDAADLSPVMASFPQNFHEPFYRDYIAHPMEKLIKDAKFHHVHTDLGFFSKVGWAHL